MGIGRMMETSCIILRRSGAEEEEFGKPDSEVEEVEANCALQQRQREEHEEHGEISDSLWDLFLPHGTEIDTGDAVRVRGREYELVGEPWSAEEGSRSMWHVEATVRRVEGSAGS